jgi:arabinose-5-phosphate isomerase
MVSEDEQNRIIINTFNDVFDIEIDILKTVKNSIDKNEFVKAVNIINDCKGKVVFTGIGKSGIIAKKISATLSSTGTKSLFIHPVEGMHGDFGIIEERDCIFIISKSGKSEEICSMLPFFKAQNLPILSIIADKESEIAKKSDVVLYMKIDREACPLNLVPTCSTTASLVIGDSLAVALMKVKNFKKESFALYHPAGSLGKRLLFKVKDIMWKGEDNPVVFADDNFEKILQEITTKSLGATSVVDEDYTFIGLITDYDVRTNLNKEIFNKKAKDIMNPNPVYINESMMAIDSLILMEEREKPFNVLPVVNDEHKNVGMIRLHDLIKVGLK